MFAYFMRRCIYMALSLVIISVIAFIIIQLPPGDFVDYLRTQEAGYESAPLGDAEIASLKKQYGLDRPIYIQYFTWVAGVLKGDFGMAFLWNEPVWKLIRERLTFTMVVAFFSIIFTYLIAIPIGIYSATHQYSIGDYIATVFGFSGLAIPNFLFALILLFMLYQYFDISAVGLFSAEYAKAPWSLAKFVDMLNHLWIPMIVIGTAGTAALIRVMRGCLLDELGKQYVIVARAKGVKERKLIFKYPVRIALNPIVSTMGWVLPATISATTITAVVLNLPTLGPMLLAALQSQDMYLAGSIVILLSMLVVVGTFVSDILLAILDPRIRYT